MSRLIHDRYFAYDALRGCDLTTGHDLRLDDLQEVNRTGFVGGLIP